MKYCKNLSAEKVHTQVFGESTILSVFHRSTIITLSTVLLRERFDAEYYCFLALFCCCFFFLDSFVFGKVLSMGSKDRIVTN